MGWGKQRLIRIKSCRYELMQEQNMKCYTASSFYILQFLQIQAAPPRPPIFASVFFCSSVIVIAGSFLGAVSA